MTHWQDDFLRKESQGKYFHRGRHSGQWNSETAKEACKIGHEHGGGFQNLIPEELEKISRSGGKAAHAQGKAHTFTKEEASAAAKKSHEMRKARKAAKGESMSQTVTLFNVHWIDVSPK